ncbi:MAG: thioredoxin family protein [Halalkalicoccus sp.]|nr:thioredoxin family protein [Halalkalicoccus sp.]
MMNSTALIVDDRTYERLVETERLVLLLFSTDWCVAGKVIYPTLERLAEEYVTLTVATIDAGRSETARQQCHIETVPTTILFDRGEVVGGFAGTVPYPKLAREIERYV